jgi:ubiquinone/menaquinone biosynthesis C-methylase UbiE
MAAHQREVGLQEQYRAWWSSKRDALNKSSAEDWSSESAHELICLFGKGGTLLDVGCGNALLLAYLAPHFDEVVGIDYSPSMLEAATQRLQDFHVRNTRLEVGDACSFPPSVVHADVILSNGVAQHLSPGEISRHLRECRRVLRPGGCVGICSIPWATLRKPFTLGALRDPAPEASLGRTLGSLGRRLHLRLTDFRGDFSPMGRWYGREEVRSIADSEGFDCEIVSSWFFEYRFHARLRLRNGREK